MWISVKPEREAEAADRGSRGAVPVRAEQARRPEELPRLQRAALEVALDRRLRIVDLPPLERLAPGEAQGRVREQRDCAAVAGRRQLGERAGEQVVAGGP